MSSRSPQDSASREARKAARRARELSEICFQYADCLSAGGPQWRAEELRALSKNKLTELREALADCEEWARVAALKKTAPAAFIVAEAAAA